MSSRILILPGILLLSAAVYAAFTGGGDAPSDAPIVQLLIGAAGVAGAPLVWRSFRGRSDVIAVTVGFAVVLYAALQLLPLPDVILRVVSPERARLAAAFQGLTGVQALRAITISLPNTAGLLWRNAALVLVFLVVRGATRGLANPWWVVVPLIGTGAAVAVAAMASGPGDFGFTAGTFANRNHFANLEAMLVPLALGGGAMLLMPPFSREGAATLLAFVLLACAGVMFVAVLLSWSKGGAAALMLSLLVTAALAVGRSMPVRARVAAVGAAVALTVVFVAFLTPAGFVERLSVVGGADPTEGRVPIWIDTLHLIRAYPLLGVGLGSYYPALLPYQTYGLNLTWVNAHNDYLQLLAELGVAGGALLLILVFGALRNSTRGAIEFVPPHLRLLAASVTGAMVAFLVHSTTEFNSYVMSNAMTFSWICGVASGLGAHRLLPSSTWPSTTSVTVRSRHRFMVAVATVVLSVLVIGYSTASLVFAQSYQADPSAERRFCRWGICDSDSALAALRHDADPDVTRPVPVANLAEYLRRDPALPARWEDLGEALQRDGRVSEARAVFEEALRLSPRTPGTLLMAADFFWTTGETQRALDLAGRSLGSDDEMNGAAFAFLSDHKVPVERRVEVLGDGRLTQAFLKWSLDHVEPDEVATAWNVALRRGAVSDSLARAYTEYMVGHERARDAAAGWRSYVARRDSEYLAREFVFNRSFEFDPTGTQFDWQLHAQKGVTADFDPAVHRSGMRALRLRFDGTANVSDIGVQETAYLTPGRYRLRAFIRTDAITTNEGVRLRLQAGDNRAPVNVVTDAVRGTNDWTEVQQEFNWSKAEGLARVSVSRVPSLKFDSDVAGTAWLDDISLERVD